MAEQSITVSFTTEADAAAAAAALIVELDADKNGDETQFIYGTKVYFRVYTYPVDMKIAIIESDGIITSEGDGVSEEEEDITFANTNEGSCSKPVKSITSSRWLGNSLGAISAKGVKITMASEGVAILKLGYKSSFRRFALKLSGKSDDSYTVLVYIQGGDED